MRIRLLCLTLLVGNSCLSQQSAFFKGFVFDSTYTVIGVGQQWRPSGGPMQRFEFIVDNKADLLHLQKDWVFKQPAEPMIVLNNLFNIYILKDKKLVSSGVINPSVPNIRTEDGWYVFDTTLLLKLHALSPLRYSKKDTVFQTAEALKLYHEKARSIPSFLFLTQPDLRYEGEFSVTVTTSKEIPTTKAAIDMVNKEFLKWVEKDKFHTVYVLDEFNTGQNQKLRLTVKAPKQLYDKFRNDAYEIGLWKPAVIKATTYWRENF
jgi:hypothetical protein